MAIEGEDGGVVAGACSPCRNYHGHFWQRGAERGPAEADAALQAGRADAAMAILSGLSAPEADSALAHNLRCRVLFALEQWSDAASECQQAVSLEPRVPCFTCGWAGRWARRPRLRHSGRPMVWPSAREWSLSRQSPGPAQR